MAIVGWTILCFWFCYLAKWLINTIFKIACELNHMEAYLVTMAFYIAYTVMALPVAAVLKRIGYKNGMVYGLLVMAIGAVIFIPAAQERMYSVFLLALFILLLA